jgi:ribosomal protein L11 methyltransferase
MAWLQATIDTDSAVAERLADALMDAGALSTAIEDALAGTELEQPIFGEPGMPVDKLWNHSRIITLFAEDADVALLIAAACNACKLGMPAYKTERVEEQDWVRLTQSQFEPIRISDRLWITPTWHDAPARMRSTCNSIRPGLRHRQPSHHAAVPAVAGCACCRWRKRARLRLRLRHSGHCRAQAGCRQCRGGGYRCTGRALQPRQCRPEQRDRHFLPAGRQSGCPVRRGAGQHPGQPLRMLGQLLASHVKTGGKIVLSGILAEQADELSAIYAQWFTMDTPVFDEGWTRLTGTRRPSV